MMTSPSITIAEPLKDIAAQIDAMTDDNHPKRAVFIAAGGPFIIQRREGTLITKYEWLARLYRDAPAITDELMSYILEYPETKADALRDKDAVVVQAKHGDCVVTEAVTSLAHLGKTVFALEGHGKIDILTPAAALSRRLREGE